MTSYNEKLQTAKNAEQNEHNYIKAKSIYEELIAEYPEKFDAYCLLGILEVNLNNKKKAIECFIKAVEIAPNYECFKILGELYYSLNDDGNAIKYLKQALIYNSSCEETKSLLKQLSPNGPAFVRPIKSKITGVYESSKDCPYCKYQEIYPETVMEKSVPKFIEEILTESQKQLINETIPDYKKITCKEGFVIKIPDGRAFVKQSEQTYIITPDNKYLADMLADKVIKITPDELPNEVRAGDNMLVLSSAWGGNYYNWLTWTVPRLCMIEKAGYSLNDFDKIIVNSVGFKFQLMLLKLLGIPSSKIIASIPYGATLRAKNLVTASLPHFWHTPEFVTNSLREKFLKPEYISEDKPKRIYISRNKGFARRILNEDEVLNYLTPLGFETIYPEEMDFEDQVATFTNADIIIGQHGAGLINLAFCKPGTKVIEIYNEKIKDRLDTSFWSISSNVGLDNYFMFGESVDNEALDMIVDMNKFTKTFELAGG